MKKARKLPNVKRKAVGASQRDWVTIEPLTEDRAIPMVVRPRTPG